MESSAVVVKTALKNVVNEALRRGSPSGWSYDVVATPGLRVARMPATGMQVRAD